MRLKVKLIPLTPWINPNYKNLRLISWSKNIGYKMIQDGHIWQRIKSKGHLRKSSELMTYKS